MTKKLLSFLLILITQQATAQSFLPLYLSIKENMICVYTHSDARKSMNNDILVYMGKIEKTAAFKTSYSKIYKNIHHPNNEQDCLKIPIRYFQINKPYEVWVEADTVYKRRFCLSNQANKIQFTEIVNGYSCGRDEYDYSGKNFFENILMWLKKILSG
ncbi:NF045616 family extracytoplasmic (lipo)protein [Acinetobacter lanii]|uniref:Uncharacterized protein n=1 Tax=Acinetobacter lanii TaxID=2715163 RepID=A0A6G8S082_9GAMM|nr:NF045616 family extracytoplasmic (lipo)protein [Acinetobacter lanii]QIO07599.1 hypothetical protein G8D99_00215 [Acinetobacter lanii]